MPMGQRKNSRTLLLLYIFLALTCLSVNDLPAQPFSDRSNQVWINVRDAFKGLLTEEDTDADDRITVNDTLIRGAQGDEIYLVPDTAGSEYEVAGTYYLSNLLQELTLLTEDSVRIGSLRTDRIFEQPVERISRSIRERYWDGLTRTIDEAGLVNILQDTKTTTIDSMHYLYVPHDDSAAYRYFTNIAHGHPQLDLKVVRLPGEASPEWVERRDGYHGLLTLALRRAGGRIRGVPFVVPGGRFNEMYGWDSYFEALGLLEDGRIGLAKGMVDNFVYEIQHYGKILNANRSYYLTRSQPPLLTSMARAVYRKLPRTEESREWLAGVLRAAIMEYRSVWMSKPHLTGTGLSRYYGQGIGQPPEVEPGHFDHVYRRYAKKHQMKPTRFERSYKTGEISVPALDSFFVHDRAMRESGHDKTYRWDNACADYVTVDLNSLLYKYEMDIARTIRSEFGDTLDLPDGGTETGTEWFRKADRRKTLMNRYLWDEKSGVFFDYNVGKETRRRYMSGVVFYPLWAGVATPTQAESIVREALPLLEEAGGIAASTREARGPLSEDRPARQWDYPYGWAPHQMLIWQGLDDYGFTQDAERLAYRWLYTITRNAVDYNGTVPEKFNVVTRSHRVFAEYGNVGTEFSYITREGFGWMNASYQVGRTYLSAELEEQLNKLIPPEWLFTPEGSPDY